MRLKRKIRVLVVDDSSVIRTLLTRLLNMDPAIEVVATASDPYIARKKLVSLRPDVMTLDLEMPHMDGLVFLKKVMQYAPTPTIVISSHVQSGSDLIKQAKEAGAFDLIAKPVGDPQTLSALSAKLCEAVKQAGRQAPPPQKNAPPPVRTATSASTAHVGHILAIASSTGGTEALKIVLAGFDANIPATVVVQHMPSHFSNSYAQQLNAMFPFEVKEAEEGDAVHQGRVLIAPGGYHMELIRRGRSFYVTLNQEPMLHGVRPSADYLMTSVARLCCPNAIGLILTGMGRDGTNGLLAMRRAGGYNVAQDEASCVVFGMPKSAIEQGAIDAVVPLHEVATHIQKRLRKRLAS